MLNPKPQRKEMPEIKTMTDVATVLNYYEHLVQEWELWGEDTTRIIELSNKGVAEP